MDNLKKYFFATALAGVLYLGMAQISFSRAALSFTNGDFTDFTDAPPEYGAGLNNADESYSSGATLSAWTNAGYNFVFTNGNLGNEVIQGQDGNFSLASPATQLYLGHGHSDPYTGNIVAVDPVYELGPVSQAVTGLVIGQTYQVTFYYAGAQQSGYDTPTTESLYVALGAAGLTNGDIQTDGTETPTLSNSAEGFTGWFEDTVDFTATATSETLYFLAGGGPDGDPPFTLLADVNMTEVPEPIASSCWTLLFGMLILLGNRAWRRYQKRPLTAT